MKAGGASERPRRKQIRSSGGSTKQAGLCLSAGCQPSRTRMFQGTAFEVTSGLHSAPAAQPPARPARGGASSRGELYDYYKRMGMLEVFFALFPGS